MTLDQLIALDTSVIDNYFSEALAESIAECSDPNVLLSLSAFLDLRIRDLLQDNLPEVRGNLVDQFFQ